jgi:hypothetical protein
MAKTSQTTPQDYPRIQNPDDPYFGCLDDVELIPHFYKIPVSQLKQLIASAISNANSKSSRAILSIPDDASPELMAKTYEKEGKVLFRYFKKYCGDPASTAHQVTGQHYKVVGREQFRNRTLQKERMNSGWRYQYLALGCAQESRRFRSVSDIGAAEADFNAVIDFINKHKLPLSLYVSVKNRSNTMGGQDWPKAISALETVAKNDKNRIGPYCCIFGIAMDRGMRYIKYERGTNKAHSVNTEVWLSDFFWPFFANHSYDEIMTAVLDVLMEISAPDKLGVHLDIPEELLESFGEECGRKELIDENGYFNDPYKLVHFFVSK